MDTVKNALGKIKNFIFGMKTEQKMKFAASLLMLFGSSALALSAAQDSDDDMIDISDQAEVLDSSEVVETIESDTIESDTE